MSAHAKFAPSSASRWIECPYSALLAASLPNPESAESAEGTRVHTLVEGALRGEATDIDIGGDAEAAENVKYSVDLVLDYVRQLGGAVQTEAKVVLSSDVWGTTDVLQTQPYVTTLLDYKNGAMDVEAFENKQLLTYAAAVLEQHGPSKYYRLVIVQPWSRTAGYKPEVKQWIATLEQVEEHREKVLEAVKRGLGGEGPRPGRHCRWCSAFGNCEATREMLPFVMTAVSMMPNEVPNATAIRMLRVLRGLEDFRKNLEKDVMKRFAAGAQVPDAAIGVTQTHRKWADDRMAVEKLMAAFGLTGVDPVSPATAEKMGAIGKEIAKTLAYKPPGQPKITY